MVTARLLSCLQLLKADFTDTDCLQNHPGSLRMPNRPMVTARLLSCLQLINSDKHESDCRTNVDHINAAAPSQTHIQLESQEIVDKDDMNPARMLGIACDQELAADRIR